MLKYPCLVLDHDDTAVASEATVHYPCFCRYLEIYRPGMTISFEEYVDLCSSMSFADLCKTRFSLSDEELNEEYLFWKHYIKEHFPEPYPGMKEFLDAYRKAGGIICVVSLSTEENIRRDYRTHFGFQPDALYSFDLPEDLRKPNPYALEQIQKQFHLSPAEMLVVDDMKSAVPMARSAGCPMAFAGWGRKEFPRVCAEMETLCDYSFYSIGDLAKFLFD